MFARLQTVAARPTDEELVPMIADMVSGHPGFAGLALLAGDDSSGGLVSLWLTREDAELASERSVAIRGPRPFELTRDEAARFAGTQRLAPVLRTVPGLVRMLVLWHPTERRMAVLHLATSIAALEAVSEAVMSTKLLPGEDPALLPGPDRITLLRVAAYRAAVPAPK